jgi:Leucine-rich repeat (LRR) protein
MGSLMQGIEEFRQLSMLNLASNGLTSIKELSALTRLHQLDVKCNRLVSLKGIENCANLVKLDASHNLIQSLEAIGAMEGHSIEWLCLSGNRVNKLEELEHLTDLSRLR